MADELRANLGRIDDEVARLMRRAGVLRRRAAPGTVRESVGLVPNLVPEEATTPVPPPVPRIPKRFQCATLSSFRAETSVLLTALRATERFISFAAAQRPVMLALIGPPGVGKSHLLYAAANHCIAAGLETYARPWYRLADELRYGGDSPYDAEWELDPLDVRDYLYRAPVVFVDEVTRTASTDFDEMELQKLACHAYDNGVALMITTNVDPLAQVMGERAASRFTQVVVTGEDWRQR